MGLNGIDGAEDKLVGTGWKAKSAGLHVLPLAVSNISVWKAVIVLLSLFFLILFDSCLSIIDVPSITCKEIFICCFYCPIHSSSYSNSYETTGGILYTSNSSLPV